MTIIKKDTPVKLEFGDYGNWGTLIPEGLYLMTSNGTDICAVIKYNYGKNDSRTIELCHNELHEINFESFGTTLENELEKIGYKRNEVQQLRNKWYIIREKDGTVVPFERYEVKFDYVHPGEFGYTEKKSISCETRGEDRALKYAERCMMCPSWMHNVTIVKVGGTDE